MDYFRVLLFCSSLLLIIIPSTAVDSISSTQPFRDGDSIVSASGSFKLGFFSFDGSINRYLGISYNQIPTTTIVWVANRGTPLNDSSGVLRITSQGILILVDQSGSTIWSSNSSRSARNPIAQLLDSGNLVVKEEGDVNLENSLWQSFDYPGDTFLPEMKLGRNKATSLDRYISSSKSVDDPSRGNYTFRLDPAAYSELIMREGSSERFRSGPWNGMRFSGTPQLKPNPIYSYRFVYDGDEEYYTYNLVNSSFLSRMVINQNGIIQRFTWIDRTQSWELYLSVQNDNCDRYALCGAYATCSINNSPVCGCLNGFSPNVSKDWDTMDWSSGCVRRTPLNCSEDGFRKFSGVKLPETRKSWFNRTMSLDECRSTCLKKCSCTAYANLDISINGGSGCLLWLGDLVDMRQINENGQDIYIRMAASELEKAGSAEAKSKEKKRTWSIIISVSSIAVLFSLALILLVRRKKMLKNRKKKDILEPSQNNQGEEEDLKLPLFDLNTMSRATKYFSPANILGEGGFGTVYQGKLNDGQEIAVKRLSKTSKQGLDEFKNEVLHIVKLQHRNLVKLLGCCIEGDETMLIYEMMPNKSLDFFIFDKTREKVLDWPQRFHIINGIARGLLYLHQDSRLRIIHRDLKASNILLDHEMNPKISDFGLARSVGGNETEANTNKVVGTYGYIAPEYAIDGLYSVKSDVFSFGVMVLEIVSGKRNKGFCHPDHKQNLLGHAWRLFTEGRSSEIIAESIVESCNFSEVLRSTHIGLLCVQRNGLVSDAISEKVDSLRKGKSEVIEKNHILILGWSDKLGSLLKQLAIANKSIGGGVIVVLAERDKEEMEMDIAKLEFDFMGTSVICRSGSPLILADLKKVSVSKARAIIVLASDENADQSDARALRVVLSLTGVKEGLRGHVVVEMSDLDNEPLVKLVGGELIETVVAHDVIGRLMIQCALQPGLAQIWEDILGFENAEFYIKRWPQLDGLLFQDVLISFPEAIPCGVKVAAEGGKIKLNPDDNYALKEGDEILVIAEDDDTYAPGPLPEVRRSSCPKTMDPPKYPEKILFCGWRRDIDDMIMVLEALLAPGSELWMFNEVPEKEREKKLTDGGLDIHGLENITLVHREGNAVIKRHLENLPLETFDSILILADESLEDSIVHSDSRSLATLLLIRDIQLKRLPYRDAKPTSLRISGFSHSSWIREMQQASDKSIIISEILDSRTRNLVSVSRISDYVLSNELVSMALAMVAEDKQINRVLEELFAEEGNEMCIKPAEFYLFDQEEIPFYEIMIRGRQRNEIVIGYRLSNAERAIINPPEKSEPRKWSLDDVFVVVSLGV